MQFQDRPLKKLYLDNEFVFYKIRESEGSVKVLVLSVYPISEFQE